MFYNAEDSEDALLDAIETGRHRIPDQNRDPGSPGDRAPHTVEWHIGHLIEKLEVQSKLQAVVAAARLGLIEL